MTTPATTPRLNYIADGSTTAFTFNFKIADSNSIAVYVGSTLKTLTTDYTVTFDSGTSGTGTIVFNTAPTTASAVYLIRDTYNVRATDFQEGGAFLASTINAELDRLTQGLQDLENKIDNRVLASAEPNDESASTLTFGSAATRANKAISFDASGNLTVSSAGTGTVTSVATGTGLTGGPVTTTGTISIDSTVATLTGTQTLTNKTINSASNTITITESNISDLGSYITASSTDTLTNKTIDADNNTISNIEVDNLKSGVLDTDLNSVSASDDTLASAKAIKTYIDAQNQSQAIFFVGDDSTGTGVNSGEIFKFAGGTGITTAVYGDTLTITGVNQAQGLTFVGDDSTGTLISDGETIKIAGTQNVSTAMSGDILTITGPDLSSYITNSPITVVGDDSTGTVFNTGETIKIAGAGGVTTAVSGDTLTITGPTGTLSNVVEDTTPQLGGNLDVNGQSIVSTSNGDITLAPNGTGRILLTPGTNGVQVTTGNFSVNVGYIESEGVRIEDNRISTYRSNDNLILDPAGTGVIQTNSNINLNGYKIVGSSLAAPSADSDIVNKKYVDDQLSTIGASNQIYSGSTNVTAASTSVTTTVAGNTEMIVTDDGVRILGNLTVDGTQTILNTSTLSVEDNIITVNRNISTVGAMPTNSGLEINRGDASAATLYWNETDDKWTVGSNTFVAGTFEGNLTGNADTATAVANVITIVGDDSTGTTLNSQESFKIAGGTNITTAVSGDTLTITGPDLTGYLTSYTETDPVVGAINGIVKANGAGTISAAVSGTDYLVTETNDLTSSVTWANVPDANITQSSVTQHQAALSITESQISDLGAYITNSPITVVGDDSTGTVFNTGETIKIAGGTGITTAVSGDTLTITASSDAITALNNQAENRLVTIGATTTELDGEANLTFDGSTLTLTGTAALDGVTITDNTISTNASNADLQISANGTGKLILSANDSRGDGVLTAFENPTNLMIYEDANATFGTYNYRNYIKGYYKIDSGQSNSTSSADRYRNVLETELDLNGKSSTATSTFISRGPMGSNSLVKVRNTGGADVTLGNANGGQNGINVYANTTHNITVTEASGHSAYVEGQTGSGLTAHFTEAHGYYSLGLQAGGSGTTSATTFTHFHAVPSVGTVTNEYAFYAEDAGMKNLIGGVTLQNGAINTDGITINDNDITTSRSNDNLNISANGTGYITLGEDFDAISTNTRYHYGTNRAYTGTHSGSTNQHINNDGYKVTLTGDLTGSGTVVQELRSIFDLAGYDSTASSTKKARGPVGFRINPFIQNNSATASTVTEASGFNNFSSLSATVGNITVTDWVVNSALPHIYANTGLTGTATNLYGYYSRGTLDDGGTGTKTVGTMYHYYATPSEITPSTAEYAFYSNGDDLLNRAGKFERYREKINTLTSSSTITVDCSLAPIHTVALGTNTGFVISNLGTGQTVTIIIKSSGSYTGTFGTDGSTAVKFPGGAPTLTASGTDVVTIFNDGTDYLGNIAQAYA